jgi:hypothetical protein
MRFAVALLLALAACHNEPKPTHPGDLPPLPPASGTPIGYLIDAQTDLKLRDEQLKELKEIDASLAARDAEVDTQLRQIDLKQAQEEEPPPKGAPPKARNRAPGAAGKPVGDAAKLHQIRESQDRDALKKAWALLDKEQQEAAAKILNEHDVEVPGQQKKKEQTSDEGTPLPGMEP